MSIITKLCFRKLLALFRQGRAEDREPKNRKSIEQKHKPAFLFPINRPWGPSRSIELGQIYILVDLELRSVDLMRAHAKNMQKSSIFGSGLAWPGLPGLALALNSI